MKNKFSHFLLSLALVGPLAGCLSGNHDNSYAISPSQSKGVGFTHSDLRHELLNNPDFNSDLRGDFNSCDINNDGIVVIAESQRVSCMEGATTQQFNDADRDNNGSVTYKEFRDYAIKSIHVDADANGDSLVSQQELNAYAD